VEQDTVRNSRSNERSQAKAATMRSSLERKTGFGMSGSFFISLSLSWWDKH
jgi:hypothetical protein